MSEKYEGSFVKASEKSISMVKGGRAEHAAALAWERQGSPSLTAPPIKLVGVNQRQPCHSRV
uniref:Uncharacterized protein n=1 Tax=Anguilla anguilla TaxID=7936 RepID=A0A0E9U6S1_ANGAN